MKKFKDAFKVDISLAIVYHFKRLKKIAEKVTRSNKHSPLKHFLYPSLPSHVEDNI